MMKQALMFAAMAMIFAAPGASQVGAPPLIPPGPPITSLCPPPSVRDAAGRILGVPLPPRLGPTTPAFGGTTSGNISAAPAVLVNRWTSAGRTTFAHVIEGPVGPVRLTLETCSTATGGETVAVYPATLEGYRMPRRPRVMFSIAVPRGNVRTATLVIPPERRGARTGAVRLAVVVENASGRMHSGAYRLTVSR